MIGLGWNKFQIFIQDFQLNIVLLLRLTITTVVFNSVAIFSCSVLILSVLEVF